MLIDDLFSFWVGKNERDPAYLSLSAIKLKGGLSTPSVCLHPSIIP